MLYRILILCVTILVIWSKTTLSSSQCPSMFTLSIANTTIISAQQMQSLSQSFFSLYDGQSLQQNIQQIVIHQSSSTLKSYIMSKMVIYLIIAGLVVGLGGVFGVCCLFDRSCPPDGLRRDAMKRPYSIGEFRVVAAVTMVAAVAVVVAVIIAFSYLPTLKQNVSYTTCSIYTSLDFILNGESNSGWGGFNNLYDKIGNVTNYLTQSIPAMNAYLIGNDWLGQKMYEMKQQNQDIYRKSKDALLISPNPATRKIAFDNSLPTPTIPSRFISSTLGPSTSPSTLTSTINISLSSLQVLSSQALSIQTSALQIINSSPTILANTNSSQSSLEMYIAQLKRLQAQIDKVREEYLVGGVEMFGVVVQTVFGVELLLAFFALFGVFSVYCFQIFTCRALVLWAWIGFAAAFAPAMAIVFFTHGLGSLGFGFCNYFDSMLHQQASFNKIVFSDSQNPFNRLDVCMFGDGNVLQKFNLAEQMGTVTGLFSNINTFYDYQNSFSTNYVDMSISTSKISSWMSVVNNLKKGIFIDYDQSATTDDNPNYAIKSLSNYTYKGGSFPTCSKDRWVFDNTNCTNLNDQDTYITGTLDNGKSLGTTKSAICISFNEKLADMINSSWTENDFTARYTQIRQNCPGAYAQILTYGYAIINYRDSRQNLFQGIYDQLNTLYSTNLQFNGNISTFQQSVIDFQIEVSNLSNAVSNPLNGLLVSSDCRKIVDYLKFTQNMFCTNVMHDIIKIGWCSMIIAGFSLVGLISAFFFSLWFTQVQRNHKLFFRDFSNDDSIQESVIEIAKVTEDVGEDFQKLAIGTGGKIKKAKVQEKKVSYDTDESDEQNPYAKDMEL